ncbi:DNA topoisomerase IV subunit B family protein [Rhodococcoides navarretei]|uniref:DNA topoisomerase (ATP-hydrolyzing) n=1 Tax=Rhodococcus navarretei TaxID=3128981 RepID=A0ABU9CXM0_9NOCA
MSSRRTWHTTTHDWSVDVDRDHLAHIRARPDDYAPGGVLHLILEVLAYAADEAEYQGDGHASVTLGSDGVIEVSDTGRGTDTRLDDGVAVRKPVVCTKDVRFFDEQQPILLDDGHARRGMSVVAALSETLEHTNRRIDGAWTARYEHGIPVTELMPTAPTERTGTTIRFLPDASLIPTPPPTPDDVRATIAPHEFLTVSVT